VEQENSKMKQQQEATEEVSSVFESLDEGVVIIQDDCPKFQNQEFRSIMS